MIWSSKSFLFLLFPLFSFSVLWCVCNIDNNFTQWAISFYLIGFLVHIQVYVYVIYASFLVRCVFAISKRKGCTLHKSWYSGYLTDTIYSKEICTFTITVSKFIQTFDLTKNKQHILAFLNIQTIMLQHNWIWSLLHFSQTQTLPWCW